MNAVCESCEIISINEAAKNIFDVTIKNRDMALSAMPGQFLHIQCGGRTLLRRPISICDVKGDKIRFIFEIRGEGTYELSKVKSGEKLDVLGPLGHGFTIGDTNKKAVFVGGGIGIYPLLMTAKMYGKNAIALLGFRNKSCDVISADFKSYGCEVIFATDDGSQGVKGYVTDLLDSVLSCGDIDRIFACGPLPMLKTTAKIADDKNIYCEVSMEERMGCGVGACLVCACKVKVSGTEHYLHVCKDGPVFDSRAVIFDE